MTGAVPKDSMSGIYAYIDPGKHPKVDKYGESWQIWHNRNVWQHGISNKSRHALTHENSWNERPVRVCHCSGPSHLLDCIFSSSHHLRLCRVPGYLVYWLTLIEAFLGHDVEEICWNFLGNLLVDHQFLTCAGLAAAGQFGFHQKMGTGCPRCPLYRSLHEQKKNMTTRDHLDGRS